MLHIGTKYHAAVSALNEKHKRALDRVQEDYATELMEIALKYEAEMDQSLATFKGEIPETPISGSERVKTQASVPVQELASEPIRPPKRLLSKLEVDLEEDKDSVDVDFFPRVVTSPR